MAKLAPKVILPTLMKHSIICLSKPAFLQVTVEEYAIMYTPEGEIYNTSVLERLVCCWQMLILMCGDVLHDGT